MTIHPAQPSLTSPAWMILDSEDLHARDNMSMDELALEHMDKEILQNPMIRFFEWAEPAVTYGYLLSESEVRGWTEGQIGGAAAATPVVKRPTGGGVVFHHTADLGMSCLWPRRKGLMPESPRACYRTIHRFLKSGLEKTFNQWFANTEAKLAMDAGLDSLAMREPCAAKKPGETRRLSVCFSEPVCDDIMRNGEKVIGGALRFTRNAALYQGAIRCEGWVDKLDLKETLKKGCEEFFAKLRIDKDEIKLSREGT